MPIRIAVSFTHKKGTSQKIVFKALTEDPYFFKQHFPKNKICNYALT
jgi:hypothetical protein